MPVKDCGQCGSEELITDHAAGNVVYVSFPLIGIGFRTGAATNTTGVQHVVPSSRTTSSSLKWGSPKAAVGGCTSQAHSSRMALRVSLVYEDGSEATILRMSRLKVQCHSSQS